MSSNARAFNSPINLGAIAIRNRIVSTAHQTGLVKDHMPTPELAAYHLERARGGVGAIFLEATAVHPTGLLTPKTLAGYLPEMPVALAPLASQVRAEGAALLVQLFHGGREQIAGAPRPPAVGPSAVPSTRFHVEPRALAATEIDEIIAGYATSARHMLQAGLDGVEISSSHAYLPSQFFANRSNRRTDAYGPEQPLRFLTEVIEAIRAEVGDRLAVGIRLALDEMSQSGLDESACLELSAEAESSLPVDFVSFTMGDSATFSGGAFIAPRPRSMPESILSRMPKRSGVQGPVRIAATRVVDIEEADAAIADGRVDLVGMTRAQIADPRLVNKALAGEPIIPCTGCNVGCIGHYHAGQPIACVMNQATGREVSLPQPRVRLAEQPADSLRIAIVGAGVAGMSAAIEAAGAGHRVTVFEKEAEIGGQLRIAGIAPDHETTWRTWHEWQLHMIAELTIDLQLNREASVEDLAGFDSVIDARGAVPFADDVNLLRAAMPDVRVVDAWTFIQDPSNANNVLVSDWSGEPTGLDCVEIALANGAKVHYAYAGDMPGVNIHQYQRFGYLARIDTEHCEVHLSMQIGLSVDGRPVLRGSFSDRDRPLPAGIDTIVIAHGRVPSADPDAAFGTRVGDLDGPRTLEEAALEGYIAARSLSDKKVGHSW